MTDDLEEEGMEVSYSASFRIMAKDLDPKEISLLLGMSPDDAYKRGDPNWGEQGRRYSDFSEGLWSLASDVSRDQPPAVHIKDITNRLAGSLGCLAWKVIQASLYPLRFARWFQVDRHSRAPRSFRWYCSLVSGARPSRNEARLGEEGLCLDFLRP